jgi:hypothetical protein
MGYRVLKPRLRKDGSLLHLVTFKSGDIGRAIWEDDGHGWSAFGVRHEGRGFRFEHLGNFLTADEATAAVQKDHQATVGAAERA